MQNGRFPGQKPRGRMPRVTRPRFGGFLGFALVDLADATHDWVAREFGAGNPADPLVAWQAVCAQRFDPLVEPLFRNDALAE